MHCILLLTQRTSWSVTGKHHLGNFTRSKHPKHNEFSMFSASLFKRCQIQNIRTSIPTLYVFLFREIKAISNVFRWDCIVLLTVSNSETPSWMMTLTSQLYCVGEFVKNINAVGFFSKTAQTSWKIESTWIKMKLITMFYSNGNSHPNNGITCLGNHFVFFIFFNWSGKLPNVAPVMG